MSDPTENGPLTNARGTLASDLDVVSASGANESEAAEGQAPPSALDQSWFEDDDTDTSAVAVSAVGSATFDSSRTDAGFAETDGAEHDASGHNDLSDATDRALMEEPATEVRRTNVERAGRSTRELIGVATAGASNVRTVSPPRSFDDDDAFVDDVSFDGDRAHGDVTTKPKTKVRSPLKSRRRPQKSGPTSLGGVAREYVGLVVGALVIATLIRTFLGLAFYIPSGSMIPTLEVGDRVVVSRLSYAWGEPQRGQVVVFENPNYEGDKGFVLVRWGRHLLGTVGVAQPTDKYFIKRVIGLPGETITFTEGRVHINGKVLDEPWLQPSVVTDPLGEPSFVIPAGNVFLMGDNRGNSTDGRVFGPVDEDRIVGRAIVKVWPPGRWGTL